MQEAGPQPGAGGAPRAPADEPPTLNVVFTGLGKQARGLGADSPGSGMPACQAEQGWADAPTYPTTFPPIHLRPRPALAPRRPTPSPTAAGWCCA